MVKILIAPARYVQGPYVLADLGPYVASLGKRVFFVGGKKAVSIVRERGLESLKEASLEYAFLEFYGECTREACERIAKEARDFRAEVICGVGGGKALDTAKAVAYELGSPLVTIPTVASSDAPCSSLIVQFKEDHTFDRFLRLKRNPDLVLVDSEVIAKAPVRYLVAGMGDALSTWFEAKTCSQSYRKNVPGGLSTQASLKIARLCYETLIAFGREAKMAVERKVVTPQLERVIEANILLSGIGFESGGLALAHGIQDGLHCLDGTQGCLHGELVAFATLVHLVLEGYPAKVIERVIGFMKSVGLPTTLQQIGVTDKSQAHLRKAAVFACREELPTHNAPFPVNPDIILWGILAADGMGETLH
jgi:glycerol dehydrogenase